MRTPEPYRINYRADTKTIQITLNYTCGLPKRVCDEWKRKSFLSLPDELNVKTEKAAKPAAYALIQHLKKKLEEGSNTRVTFDNITVGEWVKKFTALETSPRTGKNASENTPYSIATLKVYFKLYKAHLKDDPLMRLRMIEVNEEDVDQFYTRMSLKKLFDGRTMGGTKTYASVIKFVRMAFNCFQQKNHKWINPFSFYYFIGILRPRP